MAFFHPVCGAIIGRKNIIRNYEPGGSMREQLRLERIKKRISQWQLAQATGIGQSRISLFECGYIKLTAGELASISDVLGFGTIARQDSGQQAS